MTDSLILVICYLHAMGSMIVLDRLDQYVVQMAVTSFEYVLVDVVAEEKRMILCNWKMDPMEQAKERQDHTVDFVEWMAF